MPANFTHFCTKGKVSAVLRFPLIVNRDGTESCFNRSNTFPNNESIWKDTEHLRNCWCSGTFSVHSLLPHPKRKKKNLLQRAVRGPRADLGGWRKRVRGSFFAQAEVLVQMVQLHFMQSFYCKVPRAVGKDKIRLCYLAEDMLYFKTSSFIFLRPLSY